VARVRFRSDHVGFIVNKMALGLFFSEILFPCQYLLHQLLHIH
jgi:hypothetical protein